MLNMHDKMCFEYKSRHTNIGGIFFLVTMIFCLSFKDHLKQVLNLCYDLKTVVFSSEGESPNQHTAVIFPCHSSWHKKSLIIA